MRNGRLAREHLATLCETGPHGLDLTRQAAVELSGLAVSVETIDALRKTAFDAPVAEPVLTDEVARFSLPYRVRGLSADVAPDGGLILEGLDSDSKLVSWRVARDGSIREGVVEGIPFSTYAVQGRDSGYWRVLEEYSRADDGAAVVWATRVVQESDQVVGFILMEEGQPPRPFEHTFRITGRHLADGTLEPPRPDEPAPFDDMVAAWQGDTAHIVLVTGTEGVWLTAMP